MKILYVFIAAVIIAVAIVASMSLLSSCTYSITQVHTEGQATDVVDETATNSPTTSVKVPTRAI